MMIKKKRMRMKYDIVRKENDDDWINKKDFANIRIKNKYNLKLTKK